MSKMIPPHCQGDRQLNCFSFHPAPFRGLIVIISKPELERNSLYAAASHCGAEFELSAKLEKHRKIAGIINKVYDFSLTSGEP